MKRYEHKIIDGDALVAQQYGKWGWYVVGVIPSDTNPRVILQRERAVSIADDLERRRSGEPR